MLIVSIVAYVLFAFAMYRLFEKAGVEGWKGIIPIYNEVVMFKLIGWNPWLVLTMIIPFAGAIVVLVAEFKFAKNFGKSTGFCVGVALLSFIFMLIMAFDESEWLPNKANEKAAIGVDMTPDETNDTVDEQTFDEENTTL